ncbi:hypothetical protein [Sulfoacidibacillus ferrooxidans]|uniref:Cytochrome B6 n=1 Tax=Sulfoacidibacillus ferrooxidans TaxID=2005001 RepID=A0A9X1VAZ4_9BACL|nr:hypothetical protein [Sulfoacidibacillus ferrooxidans]MCI0184683.1 hypothetical protein [Sulfoacidibacillus ferrooxidans]
MTRKAHFERNTLRFPQKDFDMVKEGIVSLGIVGVAVVIVAAIFGAPYRPAITNQEIANQKPILVMQTAMGDLDGQGEMAAYGPPYNNGWHGVAQNIQSIGPFSPQTWWGTPYHLYTPNADVITPLTMLATASNNTALQAAIQTYNAASYTQQQAWDNNFTNALNKATVQNGQVVVPSGQYGPVQLMMNDELALAKSGLLSGALDRETNNGVYRWNIQNDLLFLQGPALHQYAKTIDMRGEQWGINHDEQAYPGPWWLTPYTFLYQVPPGSTSPSGDEIVAYTIAVLFGLLVLLPFIPGLNKLPRVLPVHRAIWRDWYKRLETTNACASCPLATSCNKEFHGPMTAAADHEIPACYDQTTSVGKGSHFVSQDSGIQPHA